MDILVRVQSEDRNHVAILIFKFSHFKVIVTFHMEILTFNSVTGSSVCSGLHPPWVSHPPTSGQKWGCNARGGLLPQKAHPQCWPNISLRDRLPVSTKEQGNFKEIFIIMGDNHKYVRRTPKSTLG